MQLYLQRMQSNMEDPTFILFVWAHANQVIYLDYHVSRYARRLMGCAALAHFGTHGPLLFSKNSQ